MRIIFMENANMWRNENHFVQTQEQEREDANIWRTNIGSDMWRNANN